MKDIEKKINTIGSILADIQLNVYFIKRNQEELKEFLTNPDKLDFERFWRKSNESHLNRKNKQKNDT